MPRSSPARLSSELFSVPPFLMTIGALVVAPFLAAADLAGSYLPFGLLRVWMVGFAVYAFLLAKLAGGSQCLLRFPFILVGLTFAFVWGSPLRFGLPLTLRWHC